MVRTVSSVTSWGYAHGVKPLLFLQSPDAVHSRLLRANTIRQKFPCSNKLVATIWAYRNNSVLSQSIDGIIFPNPVGLSAGFDKNIELVPTIKAVGFGFMTGGSVTFEECTGNPRPWFYRLPKSKSLVVNAGLANNGAKRIQKSVHSYSNQQIDNFPLIVSIAKTNSSKNCTDSEAIKDYVGSLCLLRNEVNISAFEINISCPNTYGGEPFTTPKRLSTLLDAVVELKLEQSIWIKMPINLSWKNFDALLAVILDRNIHIVTIGNLNKNRATPQLTDDLPKTVLGNLSGLPTQKLSDELIARTYKKYGSRLTIIGVGGIFNAEDAYRKICFGASMVGLITGMIFEGPQLIGQINQDLVRLLEKDGFTNISEAIGSRNT